MTRPDHDDLRLIMDTLGEARKAIPKRGTPQATVVIRLQEAMSQARAAQKAISALLATHPHDEELLALLRQCLSLIQTIEAMGAENTAEQARSAKQKPPFEGDRPSRRGRNPPTPGLKHK